jgi:hypothetical protein
MTIHLESYTEVVMAHFPPQQQWISAGFFIWPLASSLGFIVASRLGETVDRYSVLDTFLEAGIRGGIFAPGRAIVLILVTVAIGYVQAPCCGTDSTRAECPCG